jgi:hypothetical protein
MGSICYELTGGSNVGGIKTDTELIFPNVETCVAVVAVDGGSLVGAHVTLYDSKRMNGVAAAIGRTCNSNHPDIYVCGPGNNHNLMALMDVGQVRGKVIDGFVDIKASIVGGALQFYTKPQGSSDTQYKAIDMSSFA